MKIVLSPQRNDNATLIIHKNGDILTLNGEVFDLSPIGEGDTLPFGAAPTNYFASDIERIDGELILTVTLPLPWNYSQEQAFPDPLYDVPDGLVELPKPLPEEGEDS